MKSRENLANANNEPSVFESIGYQLAFAFGSIVLLHTCFDHCNVINLLIDDGNVWRKAKRKYWLWKTKDGKVVVYLNKQTLSFFSLLSPFSFLLSPPPPSLSFSIPPNSIQVM